MDEARHDPAPDNPARALLHEQLLLVREQRRTERLNQVDRRAATGLKLLTAAAGVFVAIALGAMAWNASQDRSLVITALQVPPDLAARGLTGEVLSGQLLDRIAAIDARAQSLRAAETFRNAWSGDIQVEIPQTGVSIGQLDRYLRDWLGHRTLIGGEVFHDQAGLVMTVRAGAGSTTARGPDAQLDALLQRTAEGVFEQTQPYRYSKYLEASGRGAEAMAAARRLADRGPASERPWAWAQISNLLGQAGDVAGAEAAGRRSVALDPSNGLGWLNLESAQFTLGHEQQARDSIRRSVSLLRSGRGGVSELGVAIGIANASTEPMIMGDFTAALAASRAAPPINYMNLDSDTPGYEAGLLARLHRTGEARRRLGTRSDVASIARMGDLGDLYTPQFFIAAEEDNWVEAAAVLERSLAASREDPRFGPDAAARFLRPYLALAYARLGRAADARALLAATPPDCYRCVLYQGRTLAVLGDIPGSERAFAAAVRLAPAIPAAYAAWGQARLARGDVDGAIRVLRQAQERGPRWADPLKYEGDALAGRRDWDGALSRYAAAAERAPRWGALHLAWGRALAALGRRNDAVAKWRAAAGMDLSAADRAELNRLLGAHP